MRLARLMAPFLIRVKKNKFVELIRESPTVSGSIAETHLIFCAFCLEDPFERYYARSGKPSLLSETNGRHAQL
jgi:hypothetical protein